MTFLSPKTHTYINLQTKWGYTIFDSSTQKSGDIPNVYTLLRNKKHYIIHPMDSGVTNHDFYNKDQQSNQDHNSHQQLSYTIYDLYHGVTNHDFYNKDQQSNQDHNSHQQLSYTIYDLYHKHLSSVSRLITYNTILLTNQQYEVRCII